MSARGRNSSRRGLATRGVTVLLTDAEIETLDKLRQISDRYNYCRETRTELVVRLLEAESRRRFSDVEESLAGGRGSKNLATRSEKPDPRQVTLDETIARTKRRARRSA